MAWSPAPPLPWSTSSTARGVRVRLDDNVDQAFGWRATDWDLQGVPIRVELGPRDLAENAALLYRRDTRDKNKVGIDKVVDEVQQLTGRIQIGHVRSRDGPPGRHHFGLHHARRGARCSADGRRPLAVGVWWAPLANRTSPPAV